MVLPRNLEPGIELHINRDQKKKVDVPSIVVLDMRLLGTLVNHTISSKINPLQRVWCLLWIHEALLGVAAIQLFVHRWLWDMAIDMMKNYQSRCLLAFDISFVSSTCALDTTPHSLFCQWIDAILPHHIPATEKVLEIAARYLSMIISLSMHWRFD